MDDFSTGLVQDYLKATLGLKKIDTFIKFFAPNSVEVLNRFARLAAKFEDAEIYPYAAMSWLGVAKCEHANSNSVSECQAYLQVARAFLLADQAIANLCMRSSTKQYTEGALRYFKLAVEISNDEVMKAAIIREIIPIQSKYEETSSFSSPAHRINEIEVAAKTYLQRNDFLTSLSHYDDIVDNITERKQEDLYVELLGVAEIIRILLLVVLNLPPSKQSPAHIQLIQYYYSICHCSDIFIPSKPYLNAKYIIADMVGAWIEQERENLQKLAQEFIQNEMQSIPISYRNTLNIILNKI